jgi:hypothetical protein
MKLPSIPLGLFSAGKKEKTFSADLDLLIEQNLLLQANSGGGKSWALRRIIEAAYGRMPIIVIDPEGEFSSLRARFDFLLVGKGGETPADVRSAKLLAHRLLEHRVSAVCDIYELAPRERSEWVASFVRALVDAPKELWTDVMIVVDEAHDFAPEKGHGSSTALEPMAALASKGRKRGQMLVAATQRIGKFSKDVAAELKNALVGLTWLDIDRDRAADSLGISKANRAGFFEAIKLLEPGHFFGLGRALKLLDPTLLRMDRPETPHPKRGQRRTAPPPPTKTILHLLPQLGDLPKEVEEQARTEIQLRSEAARLRRELDVALKRSPVQPAPVVLERVPETLRKSLAVIAKQTQRFSRGLAESIRAAEDLKSLVEGALVQASEPQREAAPGSSRIVVRDEGATGAVNRPPGRPRTTARGDTDGHSDAEAGRPGRPLGKTARAILSALVQIGERATSNRVAIVSGYSVRSSGFANALSELRVAGLLTGGRDALLVTEEGRAIVGDVPPLPSGRALLDWWLTSNKIGKCEKALLSVIYKHRTVERSTLAAESGYSAGSSGFANALSTLRTLELASGPPGGGMKISDAFLGGAGA